MELALATDRRYRSAQGWEEGRVEHQPSIPYLAADDKTVNDAGGQSREEKRLAEKAESMIHRTQPLRVLVVVILLIGNQRL